MTASTYAQQMAGRMPVAMPLPDAFRVLYDWMEANGFFMPSEAYPGDRLGLLDTEDAVQSGRATTVLFRVATREQAREFGEAWFGTVVPDIASRLIPFARTGGDGSHAAFWRDDAGRLQIVHLGSEGHVFLLGRTPLDFLRLLAIGYDEVSGDCVGAPTEPPRDSDLNTTYRAWLIERFGVTIPATASGILGEIPDVWAETSDDPFWRWVRKHQAERDKDV